jgi:hypothetical protein
MEDAERVAPDTVVRMGAELVRSAVTEEDLEAVAGLLSGLVSEMLPMRAMEIYDSEPATTYDPTPP